MNKKIFYSLIALFIICSIIVFAFMKHDRKIYNVSWTSAEIRTVTAKFEEEGIFYLTVVLDDSFAESNHLSDREYSMQTTEAIYEKVILGAKYTGAAITIHIPQGEEPQAIDAGTALRIYGEKVCEITELTLADGNQIIR